MKRKTYNNHLIVGYININSLKSKISSLREIIREAPVDLW